MLKSLNYYSYSQKTKKNYNGVATRRGKSLRMCLLVSTNVIVTGQTDRQTDGRATHDGIGRACSLATLCRATKIVLNLNDC